MANKPNLIFGQTYNVEIIIGASPGNGNRPAVPKTRHIVQMKLVEKRANGEYWMERETWILLDPPFTGRADHKYRKGHELVKVKQSQIKAAV